MTKMRLHLFNRPSPDPALVATFNAATGEEAEKTAYKWLASNLPSGWKHAFSWSAQLAHSLTPNSEKLLPIGHIASVTLLPGRDATDDQIAGVRASIAKLPSK
jgi:ABC-type sugar transport system substrate-binding protein